MAKCERYGGFGAGGFGWVWVGLSGFEVGGLVGLEKWGSENRFENCVLCL